VVAQEVPSGRQLTPPYYVFQPDLPHDIVTQDVGAIGFQKILATHGAPRAAANCK
jgi:hypothetical protein